MHRYLLILIVLFIMLIASACQPFASDEMASPSSAVREGEGGRGVPSTEEVSPLSTPNGVVSVLATPDVSSIEIEPGRAVVTGRILSAETAAPIVDVPVRLAEIYYSDEEEKDPEQAAWALSNANSPFAYSDANGFFVFENVEARDYVVFVGDILEQYAVETNEEGNPRPRTVAPDEVVDLGEIIVDY